VSENVFLKSLSSEQVEPIVDVLLPTEEACASRNISESARISIKLRPLNPRTHDIITKRATERKIDRGKNRQDVDISEERFVLEMAKAIVVGWDVSVAQWRYWVPANPPAFSDLDVKPTDQVPYSPELFCELARRAIGLALGTGIVDAANNPKNFNNSDVLTEEDEIKN